MKIATKHSTVRLNGNYLDWINYLKNVTLYHEFEILEFIINNAVIKNERVDKTRSLGYRITDKKIDELDASNATASQTIRNELDRIFDKTDSMNQCIEDLMKQPRDDKGRFLWK